MHFRAATLLLPLASLLPSSFAQFYPIVGVNTGVQPRLEIRTMQQDSQLWNLFLAGLERLQWTDQNNQLSWYQIAGIHGQPAQSWDNDRANGDPTAGYCPHSSNMFLTWHRPYLALMEQMIYEKAMEMVNGLPDGPNKSNWISVANRLRFPYWDWAINPPNGGPTLPDAVTRPQVTVTYPDGHQGTIDNPLFQFRFHPAPGGAVSPPFDQWDRTVRNPQDISNTNSPSNNAEAENNLRNSLSGIRSNLYTILTQFQSWNQFSNHGSESSQIGNLESIHDTIHTLFGNGHMLYPIVAAFDPIFWLHHANVDRIGAMFQRVYPQTWIDPFAQSSSTFFYNQGDVLDNFTPLHPFHANSNGDIWTSQWCADIQNLQYTYPELQNGASADSVRTQINNLYGTGSTQQQNTRRGNSRGRGRGRSKRSDNSTMPATNSTGDAYGDDGDIEYICTVEAPWGGLGGSYVARLFLGEVTTQPLQWMQDPNYCGTLAVLARPGLKNNAPIRNTVILTEYIDQFKQANKLQDLSMDSVLDFIKSKLTIKVQKDGVEIDIKEITGLKVSVYSTKVQPATSDSDFPKWLGLTQHLDVHFNCTQTCPSS